MVSAAENARKQTHRSTAPGWQRAAVLAIAIWLVYRITWIAARPAVLGTAPYVRMFNREEIVTGLFGRKWLPFLQTFIKGIFDFGGTADDVQVFMAVLGTGLIAAAGYYLYRTAGLVPGLLFAVLLSTNFNVMWINASPYQETPFYLFAFVVLWRLRRISERRDASPAASALALLPWVALALLCRYEGFLLSISVGVAIAVHWWRDRGLRKLRYPIGLFVVFAALPMAALLLYTGLEDDRHSAFTRGIQLEQVRTAIVSLWDYLSQPGILFWIAVGLVPFFTRDRERPWPPDHIAAALYVPSFTLVFLILSPFVPVTNSRFHVPLALAILACASAGAPMLARALWRELTPQRGRILTALLLVVFVAHAVEVWTRMSDSMAKRSVNKERDAVIGRVVDARIASPTPVLFAWERGEFDVYPSTFNMKIAAYVRGPTARIQFREDYEALDTEGRRLWIGEAGGMLLKRNEIETRQILDLLRTAREVHGDELLATQLPLEVDLVTWNARPTGEGALYPSRPFLVSEIFRRAAQSPASDSNAVPSQRSIDDAPVATFQ